VYGKRQEKRFSFGDSHRARPPKSDRTLVLSGSTACDAETHYPFDLFGVTRMTGAMRLMLLAENPLGITVILARISKLHSHFWVKSNVLGYLELLYATY